MRRSNAWMVPLTGVAFVVLGIVSFIIMGEPKSADDPVEQIVGFYTDNKDQVMISTMVGVAATVLLVFFAAYLRTVLRRAEGEPEMLALLSFIGLVVVAVGFAIDGTISFALADRADDIDPTAVQALQALWDNDFVPIILGVLIFLWSTGIAVIRTKVFPVWLGWLMLVLGVLGFTPIGFVAAIGAALIVLGLSITLALAERKAQVPPASTPAEAF